jgi:hypothetical protein
MPFSPDELITKVTPHLPSILVPQKQVKKIRRFAKLLPKELILERFGFETVLNSRSSQVDLGLVLDIPSLDLDSLKEWFSLKSLSPTLRKNATWKQVSSLIERAVEEQVFQKTGMNKLWLEFDVGSDKSWPPLPNICPTCFAKSDLENSLASLEFLQGKKLSSSATQILRSARDHGLSIHVFGCMLARESEWIKMAFGPLSLDCFEPFLRDISYTYPLERLRNLIRKILPVAECVQLQIDMMETLSPRIGIECIAKQGEYQFSTWEPLLDLLISEKLMSEKEKAAIFSWIGGTRYFLGETTQILFRHLSHIKVVYHPEKPLKAKLYLGAYRLSDC